MNGWIRRALRVALALAVLVVGRPSHADSPVVVLVRPGGASVILPEALTRIRGELVADGFDVSVVESPGESDPARVLAAGERKEAAATVGLFIDAEAKRADMWVVDRLTNKTVVRRIELAGPNPPEVLARRAVELLRASLLELLVAARRPLPANVVPSPALKATAWAAEALKVERASIGAIEVGASVMSGFDGMGGAAVLPLARARLALSGSVAARIAFAGLGTRPRVEAAVGTAVLTQEFGTLELLAEPWRYKWIRPSFSLGAGTYHVAVDGTATWPYEGTQSSGWYFLLVGGAGITVPLSSPFEVSLGGQIMLPNPYPVVRFLDAETRRTGGPAILGVLTLGGTL